MIVFNKPYDTLSQFTDGDGRKTLADYIPIKDVYAAGRLDRDSEGLLILTNDGILQARLTQPQSKRQKLTGCKLKVRHKRATLRHCATE